MVKPFEPEELVLRLMATTKEQNPGSLRCTLDPETGEGCAVCSKGLANRDIADELNVSRTVESHVSNMLGKTGLTTTELALGIENQMA